LGLLLLKQSTEDSETIELWSRFWFQALTVSTNWCWNLNCLSIRHLKFYLFELHSCKKDEGKGKKVKSLLQGAVGLVLQEMRKEDNGVTSSHPSGVMSSTNVAKKHLLYMRCIFRLNKHPFQYTRGHWNLNFEFSRNLKFGRELQIGW
jgi:hypothetical protein